MPIPPAARRAGLLLLGVWAAWLLLANVLLWTGAIAALVNRKSIHVEHGFAWSLYPGDLNVRHFAIRGQSASVEWGLTVDRVHARVALHELFQRRFHARDVRASGVDFALRHRIPRPKLTRERLEGLPAIPGLEAAPIKDETPPYDPPDWAYRLFSVWLQDVDARGVREIWIDKVRLQGSLRAGGAFYLKPRRQLYIAPAQLWLDGATVSVSHAQVAEAVTGQLRVRVGPIDPRSIKTEALPRETDLDLTATARLNGLSFLDRFWRGAARVEGAAGPARIDLHVQAGQVLPGSSLALDAGAAKVHTRRMAARIARSALRFEVPRGPPPHVARMSVEARDVAGGPAAAQDSVAIDRVVFELSGEPPDLAEPRAPWLASIDVTGGRIADAKSFARAIVPDLPIESGSAEFSGRLAGPPDRLAGNVVASFLELRARVRGVELAGDPIVRAKVAGLDVSRGADLSGTRIDIERARVVHPDGSQDTSANWWGTVLLPRAQVRFSPVMTMDADLTSRCRDARPLVGLYMRLKEMPGFLRGLFAMDHLDVTGSAQAAPGAFVLRDVTARGDNASLRATFLRDRDTERGAALLTVHGLSVGLGLGSAKGVHIFAPGRWFNAQEAALQTPKVAPLARAPRKRQRRHAATVESAN